MCKTCDNLDKETQQKTFIDDSGEECFRFSNIHDLFDKIFEDDEESKNKWNSYVD